MVGNFRWVLIFIIFVIDLHWQSRNFPPTRINRVHDDGRGQNIMEAQPTVLSVS